MTSQQQKSPDDKAPSGITPRRVCIIKPSALGDIVNAFPTLDALRILWPEAHISWVVTRGLSGLVENHPQIDDVIAYDRKPVGKGKKGIFGFGSFLRELRRREFDLTIDLQGLLRSALMTAATGAPVRVGLADAREGATWFYTHKIAPPGNRETAHAVDRLLAVAAAFGADVSRPRTFVAVSEADRAWARKALADVPQPRLALNLGARWETKRWPPGHFAEIARRAVREFGVGLFAVGAPEDRLFVDELITRVSPTPVINLCGQTTLPQLAALAELTDVFLSNDTGPLHLAAGAGTRVVGVYTCTSPRANGPYGPRALAVESQVECAGSYHVRCPRQLECMGELTPDRVWPVVRAQLEARRPAREGHSAA